MTLESERARLVALLDRAISIARTSSTVSVWTALSSVGAGESFTVAERLGALALVADVTDLHGLEDLPASVQLTITGRRALGRWDVDPDED